MQRLRSLRGLHPGGGDGAHARRLRAPLLLPRRHHRDLRRPDPRAGHAPLSGPRASGGRDRRLRHRGRGQGRGALPQAHLPAVRRPHPPPPRPASPHRQRVAAPRRPVGELPETAPAVADGDHPRVRAGGRGFPGAAGAPGPALAAVLRGVAQVRVHGARARRAALRRHRQPGVGEDADASLSAASAGRMAGGSPPMFSSQARPMPVTRRRIRPKVMGGAPVPALRPVDVRAVTGPARRPDRPPPCPVQRPAPAVPGARTRTVPAAARRPLPRPAQVQPAR